MKSILLLALVFCVANAKVANLKAYSWSAECAAGNPIQVTASSVTPDPILLPGEVTIATTVVSSENMVDGPGNIVDILLQKEVDGKYIDIPCVEFLNLGSCQYDLCPTLDSRFAESECPAMLVEHGIPCHCSQMVAGEYKIDGLVLSFPLQLPAGLTNGNYHAHLTIAREGRQLTCLDINLTLQVVE